MADTTLITQSHSAHPIAIWWLGKFHYVNIRC